MRGEQSFIRPLNFIIIFMLFLTNDTFFFCKKKSSISESVKSMKSRGPCAKFLRYT